MIAVSSEKKAMLKRAEDIPLEERIVQNVSSLYLAERYISSRQGKAGYFRHVSPEINEAVKIILGYIQSRIDRGLDYNIREINVSVETDTSHSDFLNKVLSRAATQGYIASNYVFKNLVEYYTKVKGKV